MCVTVSGYGPVPDAPPPYSAPAGPWYQAPPPAYTPPQAGYYGWVPPTHAFPDAPPGMLKTFIFRWYKFDEIMSPSIPDSVLLVRRLDFVVLSIIGKLINILCWLRKKEIDLGNPLCNLLREVQ